VKKFVRFVIQGIAYLRAAIECQFLEFFKKTLSRARRIRCCDPSDFRLRLQASFRVDAMPGVRKALTAESLGSLPKTLCAVAVSGWPEYACR
jgi:hypothetical protein